MVSGGWGLRCKGRISRLKYRKSRKVEGCLENDKKSCYVLPQ
jgi:hypothetical protein